MPMEWPNPRLESISEEGEKFIANNMSPTYFLITYNNIGGRIENLREEEHVSKSDGNKSNERRDQRLGKRVSA
jgi:hypothetical protein